MQSATVVDLIPATEQRITHTIEPTKDILRGGMDNVRQAVIHEALVEKGNNADVLLEPQYVVSKKKTLFGSKITSITVSGRPAYYTNFRVLDDSVWCNPVFRGVNMHQRSLPLAGMKSPVKKKKSYDSYTPAYRTKGFAMYLTPFIGGSDAKVYDSKGEHYSTVAFGGALLNWGYQLNPYVFVGVGSGLDIDPAIDNGFVPLFANVRFNLSKKQNTPFVDVKIGTSLVLSAESDVYNDLLLEDHFYRGIAVGYSWGNVDVAYQYFIHGYDRFDYDEYIDQECYQIQNGVSIGFRF